MTEATRLLELAERVRCSDPYIVDYLLGWTGLGPQQPWGAATSFAQEVAHSYGLIRGESDPTPTADGIQVAKTICRAAQGGEA